MTCLHARAADMTPGGSEPPATAVPPEDADVELVAAPGPLATLPHPAVASATAVSRPPVQRDRFPAMATTHYARVDEAPGPVPFIVLT
jgi:hypothetical protein